MISLASPAIEYAARWKMECTQRSLLKNQFLNFFLAGPEERLFFPQQN